MSLEIQTEPESDSEELLPSALDGLEADIAAAKAARHAFNPGDLLKDGRYRPFRKIGKGSSSKVWLARDEQEKRYVAIKVGFTWHVESQMEEISSMNVLAEDPILEHPGKQHIVELLDDFIHEGPNGEHVCIVTKPLGRSIDDVLFQFNWEDPAPYSFSRHISIQALRALDYVHQKDIMHGDIQPGNFLLELTYNIDEETEWEIKKRNIDNNPLKDRLDVASGDLSNANVILVDFGASKSPKDAPGFRCAYPIPYRAPEVAMDIGGVTAKADIWALGCMIWFIVTGNVLFPPGGC